jgi:predicted ester cyclase
MTDPHSHHKTLLAPLRTAMADFDTKSVRRALDTLIAPQATIHLCHPFGSLTGPAALFDTALAPLYRALPDLERRDWIVMAGPDDQQNNWVGCGGTYIGTFTTPFLNIPPTGHLVHMRFHEFYRFDEGRIVEIQAIWDIPELMMQASAWPMAPGLGRHWHVPGPATQDGLVPGPRDTVQSDASRALILDMLTHMTRHPAQGGPEVMDLPRFWHPRMTWYGPAGIGTARGISGFRHWHQIPFLHAMPDRGQYPVEVTHHFFGDGDYAAVTGWPNMAQTLTGAGWLGLPATGQKITLRSLDFWRVETGRIRENWVLVDLLDVYHQLGLDVLARMGEFNRARVPGSVPFPIGVAQP